MVIDIRDLSVVIDGRAILDGVSAGIGAGERWAVIGKNGAGKTTLIRCLAALQQPSGGAIEVNSHELSRYGAVDLAKVVAYVPQAHRSSIPFRVEDYVLMGRFPHQGFFALPSKRDKQVVGEALELTDTRELSHRDMYTLSGGEIQRVLLAGAVAQHADILLLDEPTTFLDPLHQELIYRALDRVHSEMGTTIVMITHDVNAALTRCSHVLALMDGRAEYGGPASELIAGADTWLERIYGLRFEVAMVSGNQRRIIVPGVLS